MNGLVSPRDEAQVKRLATGFGFTEGPVWNSAGEYLLFSDLARNVIWRWDMNGVRTWRTPSNTSNGLAYDTEGKLIACEHATRRVTKTDHDGTIATMAPHFMGRRLNSPNDVVVRSDGSVYFTDPGSGPPHGSEGDRELEFQGIFRITPDGNLILLADDFESPNGLCFSPDESLLYINDSVRMHIRVFDVTPDGRIVGGRVFFRQEGITPDWDRFTETLERTGEFEHGLPDGMKTDEHGNVYCTGPGGIWVISSEGDRLEIIETPEIAVNMNWGGSDWSTLYICAHQSVYRVPLTVRGSLRADMARRAESR